MNSENIERYMSGSAANHGDHSVFVKTLTVTPSQCDGEMLLSFPAAFALCSDIAGEHAEQLGNGIRAMMDRGLFWVAVKTKLRFYRRPGAWERVSAATWPEPPGKVRQYRDYRVTAGEETLLEGRTEWTILDTASGGLHSPGEEIYAPGMEFCPDKSVPEPFYRFVNPFPGEPFARYRVCSTDIDMGGHMNNALYARMVAGLFSTAEWKTLAPKEAELHYRASCYEGDTLLLRRRALEDGLELQAALEDGKVILLARLRS